MNTKDKEKLFAENLQTVQNGALIRFVRNHSTCFGIVTAVRDKTAVVVVDSNKHSCGMIFDAEKDTTIVNHANYEIITLEPSKYITDVHTQELYSSVIL